MTQTEKEALRDYIVSYLIANSQTINGLPDVTSLDGISSFPVIQQQDGNKYIAKKVPFDMMITEFRYNAGYIQYKDLTTGNWINIISDVELVEKIDLSRYVNIDMDQIINGIKTFNDSPIVPDPITSLQAVNKKYADDKLSLKVDKLTEINSGNGLTGGGGLSSDIILNIESANDGILINSDNIELQTVNNLQSESITKPLSSLQGKILNDTKVDKSIKINNYQLINDISLSKSDVGLSNVDNTSDVNKPISESTQNALNLKADLVNGQIPASQLPSYVDDILEYPNLLAFPLEGEAGKLYVDLQYNLTYRWSGSIYVEVGKSLALGETDSTAYRGDRGKAAYDHSLLKDNPHSVTKTQVGLSNVDNTSDINKPISTDQQAALNNKADKITTITAGAGLIGGGDLSSNKTINIASANDGIIVNSDNIQLSTIDNLTTTSTTKPLSANQGKLLSDKIGQVETDLNIKNAEQYASIKSIEQLLSQSNMNQTAQVSSSGRESISLPKTASNGGMDVKLEGLTAQNLVANGDFRNGTTGWIISSSDATVSNNTLSCTGSGTASFPSIGKITNLICQLGVKVLIKVKFKVTNPDCKMVDIKIIGTNGGEALIQSALTPTQNKEYVFAGITTISSIFKGNLRFQIFHVYQDAATANGKTMEVREVAVINLTATFGAGNEPDLATCDAMFSTYFEGTKSFVPAGRLKSVGKNLFDKRKVTFSNKYIDAMDGLLKIGTNNLYCYTDFIDVGMASTYVRNIIKGSDNATFYSSITYWDRDRKFISGEWSANAIFTKPATAKYVKLSTSTNRSLGDMIRFNDSFMFQVGTISTYYEPYKETELYLTAPDLRSNGNVKDEVRKGANGYEHVKRVGVGTLGAELITNGNFESGLVGTANNGNGSESTWTLNTVNPISGTQDGKLISTVPPTLGAFPRIFFNGIGGIGAAVISFDYKVLSGNFSLWGIISGSFSTTGVNKPLTSSGTFNALFYKQYSEVSIVFDGSSLGEIQIDNVSIKMLTTNETPLYNFTSTYNCNNDVNYTIATPIITPIDHAGILNSAESGTVFHEPVVADAGVYGTNISILNTTYTISSLEEIMVHTNVDTYLDVSKAVIASDRLSFTHPDLRAGDLVLFTYFFSKEKVNGLITATYYDGRYVIADTANGKFYKWGVKSTNGVATIQLTEV